MSKGSSAVACLATLPPPRNIFSCGPSRDPNCGHWAACGWLTCWTKNHSSHGMENTLKHFLHAKFSPLLYGPCKLCASPRSCRCCGARNTAMIQYFVPYA